MFQRKSKLVKEELTARAWEGEAAPESPILFIIKFKLVKEELVARAWEREAAPESPIMFQRKFKLVKEELVARAWEREAAPEEPMLFLIKFKLVKEELVARALERAAAPEPWITTPLKSKLLMWRCNPRVQHKLVHSKMQPKANWNNSQMSSLQSGSIEIMLSAIILITVSAVSLLVEAKIPNMNKNTSFCSFLNLSSFDDDDDDDTFISVKTVIAVYNH